MHPAIPHLVELQRVDLQIAGLRAELESLPKSMKEANLKISGAQGGVVAATQALAQIVAERKKWEFESQQWKDRAKKFRQQSSAVKTNEAFRALQHEIANAEAEVTKAEDRQLELMMSVEDLERGVKQAETRLREDEQEVATQRKAIESEGTEKKKLLDSRLAEREKILQPIPDDMRDLYARLAKRHNGMAMAQARDGQCRGCGMRVLPHILQELRMETSEELFRCEGCGLILYSLDPVPVTQPGGGPPKAPSPASSAS
jgi:predicted  nucleic acid-binding Zn-ribbon protein